METNKKDLWHCPKCGGKTTTYRHLFAKVWCPDCGFVLREEGDKSIVHDTTSTKKDKDKCQS